LLTANTTGVAASVTTSIKNFNSIRKLCVFNGYNNQPPVRR
jgi:hypothetical protein